MNRKVIGLVAMMAIMTGMMGLAFADQTVSTAVQPIVAQNVCSLSATPTTINFGTVAYSFTSPPQSITVTNGGTAGLNQVLAPAELYLADSGYSNNNWGPYAASWDSYSTSSGGSYVSIPKTATDTGVSIPVGGSQPIYLEVSPVSQGNFAGSWTGSLYVTASC